MGKLLPVLTPAPAALEVRLDPDVLTGRAGSAQVVQHSTAGISLLPDQGAAGLQDRGCRGYVRSCT